MGINIIVTVGIAIWALISGLLVYIWRTDRAVLVERLNKIEVERDFTLKGLISNPILTITSHTILCSEMWKHLCERMDGMETSIKKEIRIAVLEASKNGKK